ncbi:Arginine transport system permease protein ArtQ [uncultured Clostridium sp.]|uniref:amino acid ABC transporter permease n=1 Tax=uncultured Clostridium sp. TaxID=59620 RepID=UPI0008215F9D|nr:amino acid ABC transporter permease [uncultured Clostridium sp.]SCJ33564.1 Arginine transport system permease protein ArtQ [uncultured Clostridium sp.]
MNWDFDFITNGQMVYFLQGAKWTLVISLASVVLGVIFGSLLTLLKRSKIKIFKFIAAAYVEIVRGTPLLLQIFIVYFGLSNILNINELFAVIIALSLNSAAYVSELIRAGIEAVDKGQMEAARSLGMTEAMAMRKIVIPQAIKNILPAIGNEFVAIIKESSMASTLGVAELMYAANVVSTKSFNKTETLIMSAVFYFVMTFSLGRLIKYIERRMKVSDTN